MDPALDFLHLFLVLCALGVWAFGAYHQFMFDRGLQQEWLRERPRWGSLNSNRPEPYRTHRWRSTQAGMVFLALCALGFITLYIKRNGLPF